MSKLDDPLKRGRKDLEDEENQVETDQVSKKTEQGKEGDRAFLMNNLFRYIQEKFPELDKFMKKMPGVFERARQFSLDGFERGRKALSARQLEDLESKIEEGEKGKEKKEEKEKGNEKDNEAGIGRALAEEAGIRDLRERIDKISDSSDAEKPKTTVEQKEVVDKIKEAFNRATAEREADKTDKKKGGE
ncbi:MAG TPA: hypothetical protein GX706_02170 [Candidatus Moranbacteria bacterium]|nr:hypothetical protein [Candidatus Moranbacteria bacterium]